jgi:hypothetical protein
MVDRVQIAHNSRLQFSGVRCVCVQKFQSYISGLYRRWELVRLGLKGHPVHHYKNFSLVTQLQPALLPSDTD